ncbi:MAG: acetate--CoA ligase family protein, partial [Desulfuromonadales bacterium]|nr:acetate--CoA ligase family protein [Desulfuromonadales bacterium]
WYHRKQLPQYKLEFDQERAAEILAEYLKSGKTVLGEMEGAELLQCYGFNTLPMELATSATQAATIADKIGYPVVMKIVSPQILHKTEAGGVKIGIQNAKSVQTAFDEIMAGARKYSADAELCGVLVQKMAPPGEEVILGMTRDPKFGPLLMFGLGGIYVELFKDVVFRIAPFGRNVARRMIKNIQGYPMLKGFRGRSLADVEAVEKMLVSLGQLAENHPEIEELDVNPLLVHEKGQGATVADVMITLKQPERKEPEETQTA